MDWIHMEQVAKAVLAVGTAAALIIGWVRSWRSKVRCAIGRIRAVWSTLEQMPELRKEYDGLKGTVTELADVATLVKDAVVEGPNSLQVRVGQLHEQGQQRGQQLAEVARKVDNLGHTLRATQNANPRLAVFKADHDGQLTDANRYFLIWTGLPLEDALRWGWLNAVHPDDVDRVRTSIRSAIDDARRLTLTFRLVHINGSVCTVEASAEPIPEGKAPADRWEWFLTRTTATVAAAA